MASRPSSPQEFSFGSLTDDLGPQEASVGQIVQFQHLFLSPLFVVYASLLILASMTIMFYFAPKSIFTPLLLLTMLIRSPQDTEPKT